LVGAEAGGDEGVALAELAGLAPDDEAFGVEHSERVVARDVDPAAGGGGDAQDGLAVVVGERGDRLQFAVLVDHADALVADVGDPAGAGGGLAGALEEFGDGLHAAIGPYVGVGGETLTGALRSVD